MKKPFVTIDETRNELAAEAYETYKDCSMENQEYLDEVLFLQSRGDYEGLKVDDLSEVPDGYRGEVLHVNDHGNVTLYRTFKNGNLREIASRV